MERVIVVSGLLRNAIIRIKKRVLKDAVVKSDKYNHYVRAPVCSHCKGYDLDIYSNACHKDKGKGIE